MTSNKQTYQSVFRYYDKRYERTQIDRENLLIMASNINYPLIKDLEDLQKQIDRILPRLKDPDTAFCQSLKVPVRLMEAIYQNIESEQLRQEIRREK